MKFENDQKSELEVFEWHHLLLPSTTAIGAPWLRPWACISPGEELRARGSLLSQRRCLKKPTRRGKLAETEQLSRHRCPLRRRRRRRPRPRPPPSSRFRRRSRVSPRPKRPGRARNRRPRGSSSSRGHRLLLLLGLSRSSSKSLLRRLLLLRRLRRRKLRLNSSNSAASPPARSAASPSRPTTRRHPCTCRSAPLRRWRTTGDSEREGEASLSSLFSLWAL